jgi:hypothetical protein
LEEHIFYTTHHPQGQEKFRISPEKTRKQGKNQGEKCKITVQNAKFSISPLRPQLSAHFSSYTA